MPAIHKKKHWTKLYRRALFEGDRNKLPLMLEQAYQAVQRRVRELRCSPTQARTGRSAATLMSRRTISVSCGLLKSSNTGFVCHNRSSNEGLPRGMEFGNMRGHGGLATSNKWTQHSGQGRPGSSAANITRSSFSVCCCPSAAFQQNHGLA